MLKANLDKDLDLIFTGNGYLFSYFRKVSKSDEDIITLQSMFQKDITDYLAMPFVRNVKGKI